MPKLKNVIAVTIYVVIVSYIVIITVSIVVTMIQPTLFPNTDVSGFSDMMKITSALLGIISAGLAVYSVYQSTQNNKESQEMLSEIKGLRNDVKTVLGDKYEGYSISQAELGKQSDKMK